MIFDLHVHTSKGGIDSRLSVEELIEEAQRMGLNGVCITEHAYGWEKGELEGIGRRNGIVLIGGMEVSADLGHIAVIGLERYVSGMHKTEKLRSVVEEVGGFTIALHPFRRYFDYPHPARVRQSNQSIERFIAEEMVMLPIFDFVDEVEVLNGACNELENCLGLEAAKRRGMTGTGGSDAHSREGIGYCVTVFERDIQTKEDLIQELRARRFYPATRVGWNGDHAIWERVDQA